MMVIVDVMGFDTLPSLSYNDVNVTKNIAILVIITSSYL